MKLKNDKVIVISGYARGGTNIAWNILQSHPDVGAPNDETGQIFRKSPKLRLLAKRPWLLRTSVAAKIIDSHLFHCKMSGFENAENRFVSDGVPYTHKQMERTAICLKCVNDDIMLVDTLRAVYPDLYFIFLARDGYALCDGYIRRGKISPLKFGSLYDRIAAKAKELAGEMSRFHMVKFEEMLRAPFTVAERLFAFLDLEPRRLPMLRLKSKRVISSSGAHQVPFGAENSKYWVSPDTIQQILQPDIDCIQIERLDLESKRQFELKGCAALEYFGYQTAEADKNEG